MNPTSDSRVFSSAKRLLALLEIIAECHIGKSLNGPNRLPSSSSSFSQASSIITETMTMSQTRRSGIFYGVLHAYQSALNELKLVEEWFTSTLELTLPVPRHFRVNN